MCESFRLECKRLDSELILNLSGLFLYKSDFVMLSLAKVSILLLFPPPNCAVFFTLVGYFPFSQMLFRVLDVYGPSFMLASVKIYKCKQLFII